MKKVLISFMFLLLFVFVLSGASYCFQGRMGGMGDPYGLVEDESDFLIHPAGIATGEGVRFYSHYRFTYTGVLDWDNEVDIFNSAGTLLGVFPKETSGDELRHEALVGSSFPLGPGRMGLFFTYAGMRGDYDGALREEWYPGPTYYYDTYDLKSNFDNFAFRLLYGLPVGNVKLGGEVQIAYRQEENKALYDEDMGGGVRALWTNYFYGDINDYENTFPLMLPYDSSYWEALFKGSLEGKVGPLDLEFTLRGGFLFAGDNQYEYEEQNPIGTPLEGFDLKGDVSGWCIGGDVWARYPLANDLSLPFLVRINYQEKTRDGEGPGLYHPLWTGYNFTYKSQEERLHLEVGGGLDKALSRSARIAGGIYYNYLQGDNALTLRGYLALPGSNSDHSDYPASIEHQVMLRLAGELELSPAVTLRMGLAPFYGWVKEDFTFNFSNPLSIYTHDGSLDGYHWGVGVSLGGTIRFKPITLEPFITGGWQQLHLKGDGDSVDNVGVLRYLYDMSKDREEWNIGGGFSVLFGL